jgi:transcriptional regulator with XRE-family HTH domain
LNETVIEVGRRIRRWREARGLSQGQLARQLGKTQTALSYWEAGRRAPGIDDLVELAAALSLDVSDLMPVASSRPDVAALFRAESARLDMPAVADAVDDLLDSVEDAPPVPRLIIVDAVSATEAARQVLAGSQITTPPVDVAHCSALCGARVIVHALGEGVSGMVLHPTSGAVIVISDKETGDRQRFTIAHELGHLVLRHAETFYIDLASAGITGEAEPPGYNWRNERAANMFAADLLMPEGMVRQLWDDNADVSTLAKTFRVSRSALAYRLAALGLK